MTTKFQKRRAKLAEFLEELREDLWNFNTMVSEKKNPCGSVTCALGWCPVVFPKLVGTVKFYISEEKVAPSFEGCKSISQTEQRDAAAKFFGISSDQAEDIFFSPKFYGFEREQYDLVKPHMVAKELRKLAKLP